MRAIPIGHSAGTGAFLEPYITDNNTAHLRDYFLGCGGDNSSSVDFIAYDQYATNAAWATKVSESSYKSLYNDSLDSFLPQSFSTSCRVDREKRTFEDRFD